MNGNLVTAYIGLGSNIGKREEYLNRAIERLKQTKGIEVVKVSSFINTSPVGYTDQPDFLNAAVEIRTVLKPEELMFVCNEIENFLNRERTVRWGPRTIDLDILLYGDYVINQTNLTIPHPRMHEREFVLKPLNEIASQAIHPVLKQSVGCLFNMLLHKRI